MCCCFGRKVSAGKSISAAAAFYETGAASTSADRYAYASTRTLGGAAWWPTSAALRLGSGGSGGGSSASTSAGASFATVSRARPRTPAPRRQHSASPRGENANTASPRQRTRGKNRAPTAKEAAFDPSDEDQYSPPREEEDPWDPPWVDAPPVEAGTHRSKTFRQTLAATKCRVTAPNADQTAAAKRGPPPGWWSFETFETFVRTPSPATEPRAAVFVFPRAAFSSHAHRSTRRTSSAARADASLRFAERAEAASYTWRPRAPRPTKTHL